VTTQNTKTTSGRTATTVASTANIRPITKGGFPNFMNVPEPQRGGRKPVLRTSRQSRGRPPNVFRATRIYAAATFGCSAGRCPSSSEVQRQPGSGEQNK
jgi:hypothetical protein